MPQWNDRSPESFPLQYPVWVRDCVDRWLHAESKPGFKGEISYPTEVVLFKRNYARSRIDYFRYFKHVSLKREGSEFHRTFKDFKFRLQLKHLHDDHWTINIIMTRIPKPENFMNVLGESSSN